MFLASLLIAALSAQLQHTFPQSAVGRDVAFSPDSQIVATSSADGVIKLWRVADQKLVRTIVDAGEAHEATVWSVAFSPDSQRIVSSGEDKTVRAWRVADGALLRTLRGHSLNVWSSAFSPDGKLIASGSFDKPVRIWNAGDGRLLRTLTGPKEAVVTIAFSPDGQLLASGGDDSMLRIWRVKDGALVRTMSTDPSHIDSLAFTPDGQSIMSSGREKRAVGTLWKQITGNSSTRQHDSTIRIWRVRDGALQQALASHRDDVMYIAVNPDGQWLASSSEDKTAKLWRLYAK